MEMTRIPHLNKKVSRIGLGTWAIGGWMWGGSDEKNAIAAIHRALEKGINLIDTAPVYGFGKSEEIVGKAIKQFGHREEIIIATKVGLIWENGKIYRDSSRKRILKEIEDSLRRLQVDYIDLYQVHWPDVDTPFSEAAATLKELLDVGKIRSIGVSNYSPEQMEEFQKTAPLHANQFPFNLLERESEKRVLSFCLKKNLATLGYGPLCRGLLSGKMRKDSQFQGDDLRKVDPKFQEPHYSDYLKCVERLQQWVKQKHQRSLLALAVRWVLDKGVNIALWGARQPEQVENIEMALGWKLSSEDFKEIDHILAETISKPIGPEFMAPPLHKPWGVLT